MELRDITISKEFLPSIRRSRNRGSSLNQINIPNTGDSFPNLALNRSVRFDEPDHCENGMATLNLPFHSHEIMHTKDKLLSPLRTPKSQIRFKSQVQSFKDAETIELNAKEKKNNLHKVISVTFLVSKFIRKLKSLIEKRNPTSLSMRQFKFINDISFNFDVFHFYRELNFTPIYNTKSRLSILMNMRKRYSNYSPQKSFDAIEGTFYKVFGLRKNLLKLAQMISVLPVLDPSSKSKLIWDTFQCFLILFFCFKIPIELCFQVNLNLSLSAEYEVIALLFAVFFPILIFVTDLLMNFSIGFYKKGKFINDRNKIVRNYLQDNFLKDFLSLLSLIFNLVWLDDFGIYGKVFCLFFFFKLSTLKKIVGRIEEYMFLDHKSYNSFSLLQLFFRLILISHFFACIWHLIAYYNEDINDTWIAHSNLLQAEWLVRYIYSFYFVAITMTTVGFGDIIPKNTMEVSFCIIFVFIACGIFAYSLNSIGIILQDISKRENAFIAQIKIINGYMRKKNIPVYLRHRIRKYLEYLWDEKQSQNLQEEEAIINNLSDKLKSELILEANGHSLRKIRVLALNFSEGFLRSAVFIMKEVRFMPGDIIFREGDSQDQNLFLIRDGEVEIYLKTSDTPEGQILQKLVKGEVFGEFAFFTDKPRKAFARSTDFTTLISINRSEFIELLKKFPEDYEKFCNLKDNIVLNNDSRELYINCYACEKPGHCSFDCPLVHKPIIKEICLQKHLYSVDQIRNQINKERKLYYKVGIIDALSLKDDARRFCLNYEALIFQQNFNIDQSYSESFLENTDNLFSDNSSSDEAKYPLTERMSERSLVSEGRDIDTHPAYKRQHSSSPIRSRSRLNAIRVNSELSDSNSARRSLTHRDPIMSKSRFSILSSRTKKNISNDIPPNELIIDVNNEIDVMKNYSHYCPNGNIKSIMNQFELAKSRRKRKRNRTSRLKDISKFVQVFEMGEMNREKYFDDVSETKFFEFADESSMYQKLRDQVSKVMRKIDANAIQDTNKHKYVSKRRKSIFQLHPIIFPKPTIIGRIKALFYKLWNK